MWGWGSVPVFYHQTSRLSAETQLCQPRETDQWNTWSNAQLYPFQCLLRCIAAVFVQSDRMAAARLAESCSRQAPHRQSVGCERQHAEAFDCGEEPCGGLVSARKDSQLGFSARSAAARVTHWHKDGLDGWTQLYDAFRKIGKQVRLQESGWCSVGFIYYQLSFRDGHRSTLVSNEIPYEQIMDEHTLFFTHIHGSHGECMYKCHFLVFLMMFVRFLIYH